MDVLGFGSGGGPAEVVALGAGGPESLGCGAGEVSEGAGLEGSGGGGLEGEGSGGGAEGPAGGRVPGGRSCRATKAPKLTSCAVPPAMENRAIVKHIQEAFVIENQ